MYLPAGLILGYTTIVVSLLTLARLYFKKYRNIWQFVFHLVGSLLCVAFIFFMGGWAWLSFYFRWLFLVLYIVVFVFTLQKRKRLGSAAKGIGRWYNVLSRLIFTVVLAFLVLKYFEGRKYSGRAVDLKFPFSSGTYYVMQGGANGVVNPAHRSYSVSKFGFAMDMSKLYPTGNRAKGIMPLNVKDYAIFGDSVLSPCDGKVIRVVDTVHTNILGHFNERYVHGNHVIIQGNGFRVFLAHFIKNRIFVSEGEYIKAGMPIGLAGNSGFSAEPHLHIDVLKDYDLNKDQYDSEEKDNYAQNTNPSYDDYRYTGISCPFTIDGKFYIINDMISRH